MQSIPLWPQVLSPENPTLTPFLVPGDQPRAAVIVCPGGGYGMRADHEGAPIARWINSLGLHAFVCDYRVAPARHPAPSDDAQRAIRLVRYHAAEWKINSQRVGILGFSAGGHLVCTTGNFGDDGDLSSSDPVARLRGRPDAVIACYPVISSGDFAHRGSFINLVGEDLAAQKALSLELSVSSRNPPTFCGRRLMTKPCRWKIVFCMRLHYVKTASISPCTFIPTARMVWGLPVKVRRCLTGRTAANNGSKTLVG